MEEGSYINMKLRRQDGAEIGVKCARTVAKCGNECYCNRMQSLPHKTQSNSRGLSGFSVNKKNEAISWKRLFLSSEQSPPQSSRRRILPPAISTWKTDAVAVPSTAAHPGGTPITAAIARLPLPQTASAERRNINSFQDLDKYHTGRADISEFFRFSKACSTYRHIRYPGSQSKR